jgi:hypothetical protein
MELNNRPQGTKLQNFASSNEFQNFTLFVIVLNGLWIGIDVEWNHPNGATNTWLTDLEPLAVIVENIFCSYFTFEIIVRMAAFGKANITDYQFLFDFVLVLFMVLETWVMPIVAALFDGGGGGDILAKFSVLRLLRLTRLMRLATSLPELLTLIRGMINAAKAVTVVLGFLLLLLYIFAIILTGQLGDAGAPEHDLQAYWVTGHDPTAVQLFGTMGDSMMSLFTRGLLGDNLAETLVAIKDYSGKWECEEGQPNDEEYCRLSQGGGLHMGHALMWVFMVFVCLSSFCLLNMLVGVLYGVIQLTATEEMEANQVFELKRNIERCFLEADQSGDDLITKKEWGEMRKSTQVCDSLKNIGVPENFFEASLDQIEDHLFGRLGKNQIPDDGVWFPDCGTQSTSTPVGQSGIPLEDFASEILDIRPDSAASYLDLRILQTRAEKDEQLFDKELDSIEAMLSRSIARTGENGAGTGENDASQANQLSVDRLQSLQKEGPNNGATSSPDAWLQGISTDILFAELKHRASLQANSSIKSVPDVD